MKAGVELNGADYVIFTATHALQKLPCPHLIMEGINVLSVLVW